MHSDGIEILTLRRFLNCPSNTKKPTSLKLKNCPDEEWQGSTSRDRCLKSQQNFLPHSTSPSAPILVKQEAVCACARVCAGRRHSYSYHVWIDGWMDGCTPKPLRSFAAVLHKASEHSVRQNFILAFLPPRVRKVTGEGNAPPPSGGCMISRPPKETGSGKGKEYGPLHVSCCAPPQMEEPLLLSSSASVANETAGGRHRKGPPTIEL